MADDQDHEHSFWRAVRLSRVLPADRELAAAQEIARLEVAFWQAVVEHPAKARLLRLVQRTLLGVSPQAGPVTFPRRPTAVALRSLDIDQRAERAVLQVAPDLQAVHRPIAARRGAFLTANLRLVVKIARRYQGCGFDLLDLIQEGNIGLMKGLARYDYQQGVKFSTYASWWIRHAINRAIADKGHEVRLPVHIQMSRQQLRFAAQRLAHHLGRRPTPGDLAEHLGWTEGRVVSLLEAPHQPVALDAPIGDEEHTLKEIFVDPSGDQPEPTRDLATEQLGHIVRTLMGQVLGPKELLILSARLGLASEAKTLKVIGEELGCSRERVRQIEAKALQKLRRALERKGVFGG